MLLGSTSSRCTGGVWQSSLLPTTSYRMCSAGFHHGFCCVSSVCSLPRWGLVRAAQTPNGQNSTRHAADATFVGLGGDATPHRRSQVLIPRGESSQLGTARHGTARHRHGSWPFDDQVSFQGQPIHLERGTARLGLWLKSPFKLPPLKRYVRHNTPRYQRRKGEGSQTPPRAAAAS